jgi:chromate transporter
MEAANTTNLKRSLFLSFAKIGLFTFGGGYAMISLIEAECVEKRKWITHDEMMNVTVIAESTPGPIAINCATYVGYKQAGLLGAIIATLGIVLPSFVVIYLISLFFADFLSLTVVAKAFKGIKIAVGLLILNAAITMIKKMHKKVLPRTIMLISFVVMLLVNIFSWHISSIYIMLAAGLFSLIVSTVLSAKGNGKKGAAK